MGSPLGPLMANVFLCHLEDKLTRDGVMPTFYKRYVNVNNNTNTNNNNNNNNNNNSNNNKMSLFIIRQKLYILPI